MQASEFLLRTILRRLTGKGTQRGRNRDALHFLLDRINPGEMSLALRFTNFTGQAGFTGFFG